MATRPAPKLDTTSRWLLVVTAVLITLAMVHLAREGTSVSFPTRRPGSSSTFTWEESPAAFLLYGVMQFVVASCIVLIGKAFVGFFIGEIRRCRKSGR